MEMAKNKIDMIQKKSFFLQESIPNLGSVQFPQKIVQQTRLETVYGISENIAIDWCMEGVAEEFLRNITAFLKI